jgi:hypothetical protein
MAVVDVEEQLLSLFFVAFFPWLYRPLDTYYSSTLFDAWNLGDLVFTSLNLKFSSKCKATLIKIRSSCFQNLFNPFSQQNSLSETEPFTTTHLEGR